MGAERFQCYAEALKAGLITKGIQINNDDRNTKRERMPKRPPITTKQSSGELNPNPPTDENWANMDTNTAMKTPAMASSLFQPPHTRPPPLPRRETRGRYSRKNFGARRGPVRGEGLRGARSTTQSYSNSNTRIEGQQNMYEHLNRTGQLFPQLNTDQEMQESSQNGQFSFGFKHFRAVSDLD